MATKKIKVTFTHKTALEEIREQIRYGQDAQRFGCYNVARDNLLIAQGLATFFWRNKLLSEEEWNLIWDDIAGIKIGESCNEGLYIEEVVL